MRGTYHLASPHSPAPPLPLAPSLCFNSRAGLINLLRPLPCPLSLSHPRFVSPFGPVQGSGISVNRTQSLVPGSGKSPSEPDLTGPWHPYQRMHVVIVIAV